MISYEGTVNIKDNGAEGKEVLTATKGYCLSTDTKPTTGVGNGSVLIEMDTGTIYFFDAESATWITWIEG